MHGIVYVTNCCIFESTNKQNNEIMKANDIITYATATGMNIEINVNKYGDKLIGIEWKNNHVWYWFTEFSDGHLWFTERYSPRNGTSKRGFHKTASNIEKTITASVQ